MPPGTIRELFTYADWARNRLLEAAATCDDSALDYPFEMGEGTLRKTLHHLWGAERVWLSRWQGQRSPLESPDADAGEPLSVAALVRLFEDTAREREEWLNPQDATSLAGTLTYDRPFWMEKGPPLQLPLEVSVLHLLGHFPHHAAQAINMFRQMDLPLPSLDYIVMRLQDPKESPWLDVTTLRRCFAHGDWAFQQIHEAGTPLAPEVQDRPFPIGPGSLRRILRHLADTLLWWMDNLDDSENLRPFPAIEEGDSWEDLRSHYRDAARRWAARLESLQDSDLRQVIRIAPRPGVQRDVRLGVALLQIWVHGIHHRAQALNMLRHGGASVPGLDVNTWYRQGAAGVL